MIWDRQAKLMVKQITPVYPDKEVRYKASAFILPDGLDVKLKER